MAQLLGHEKLHVYQTGMAIAAMRNTLLDRLPRRVAACDHLDRGAESTLVNIAHASSSWSPNMAEGNGRFSGTDHAKFFGIAYKATVQSASLVDLATANGSADPSRAEEGRELLRRIAALLASLAKVARNNT